MVERALRPAIRPVETIVVPDSTHGRVLLLRDTQGITDAHVAIPPALIPIVSRFTGRSTCEEIARAASKEIGQDVPVTLVEKLAQELDDALYLEGGKYRAALARVEKTFADADVRDASHAGGAYHGDPDDLRTYLDEKCLDHGKKSRKSDRTLSAIVAPHIDPWRGAVGYGHAYGAVSRALARQPEIDTFVLFGTSHAPMREHFALCKKAFATPLGPIECDAEAIDALAAQATFDPFADQLNHKREHSLEFQVVFLKHLLSQSSKKRARPRIVPILAGLGAHQARGSDPSEDASVEKFLDGVRALVASRPGRVLLVAGADFAHVGPRFGDPPPSKDALKTLGSTDKASIDHATSRDASEFWSHVAGDLDTRRVCGLAPIWSLLRSAPERATGDLLHYEQTVDEDGSVVTHAAVAFYE